MSLVRWICCCWRYPVLALFELRGSDAVAEQPGDLFVDAGHDLVDVGRVVDRQDHQVGVRVERIGGEHRHRRVGEPSLLTEAIGDARGERAAAQDEIARDQCRVIGIVVLDRHGEAGQIDGVLLVGGLDGFALRLDVRLDRAVRSARRACRPSSPRTSWPGSAGSRRARSRRRSRARRGRRRGSRDRGSGPARARPS